MSAEPHNSQHLIRAERLISHCLNGLEQAEQRRRHARERLGFELEQFLLPLDRISGGLSGVIESMAADRQDNRLQRWQGQLQQLLTPLDSGLQVLRDLLLMLDSGSEPAPGDTSNITKTPQQQKNQQLLQLLLLRQKQILLLEAQLDELRQQVFSLQESPDSNPGVKLEAAQPSTPSIFS